MLGLSVKMFTGIFVHRINLNKHKTMKTKIIHFHSLLLTLFLILAGYNINAQKQNNVIEAGITQDFARNIQGGIKPGQAHLGLINLDFTIGTETSNLWKNGTFRFHIQNTHGHTPTENLVGDVQVFSNIENGTYTYLYQIWYKHQFDEFSVLFGKHDLNEEFFASEYGGEYINSSFGIMPVASLNVPVSIFPMTTPGIVSHYDLNNSMALKAGVYNGRPGEITHTNFGMNLNLNKDNGLFYVGEFHLKNLIPDKPGTYKVGMFHHSGEFSSLNTPSRQQKGSSGIYLIVDQLVFGESAENNQGLGTMFQMGYSPAESSINDFYMAYGLNYKGLFPGRESDMTALAVAHASLNNSLLESNPEKYESCETAIEFTYKYKAFNSLTIQPNIQYIIHPGMQNDYDNAFVGMFRIQWNYN